MKIIKEFICNRKYRFQLLKQADQYFVRPLESEIDGEKMKTDDIPVGPDINGVCWFQYDFFCFGEHV